MGVANIIKAHKNSFVTVIIKLSCRHQPEPVPAAGVGGADTYIYIQGILRGIDAGANAGQSLAGEAHHGKNRTHPKIQGLCTAGLPVIPDNGIIGTNTRHIITQQQAFIA